MANHVEVASDSAFANVVQSKDVAPDTSVQCSVTLAQLKESTAYFWRVRSNQGPTTGPWSATFRFSIGPRAVLEAPTPIRPIANSAEQIRPTLVIGNALRSGPVGPVQYRFVVARDSGFASVVASATVDETPGQTSWTPSADLDGGATFYWRAEGIDKITGTAGSLSQPGVFHTLFPVWPGPYRLSVSIAPNCPTSVAFLTTYSFNGTLALIDKRLKYTTSRPWLNESPITLDVTRIDEAVGGGIIGESIDLTGYLMTLRAQDLLTQPVTPALVAGNVTGPATIQGTIEGFMWVAHHTFSIGGGCSGTFSWSLIGQ